MWETTSRDKLRNTGMGNLKKDQDKKSKKNWDILKMMAIGKKWLIPEQKKLTIGDVLLDGLHISWFSNNKMLPWIVSDWWGWQWNQITESQFDPFVTQGRAICEFILMIPLKTAAYSTMVLLVQVSVIDKISTMVANSSGSSVFILQSRGLSLSIPQHVPHCHHLVASVPTLGLLYTHS